MALDWGEWRASCPGCFTPGEELLVPTEQDAGQAPKVVGSFDEGKNLPLPGIKLWIVKIMAQSLYQLVRNPTSLLKIGHICSDLKISRNPTYFCHLK